MASIRLTFLLPAQRSILRHVCSSAPSTTPLASSSAPPKRAPTRPAHRAFHASSPALATVHEERSYYDILNLPVNATPAEIKRRYYELSKKAHPDHNPSDPTAAARFSALSTAYTTLSNPSKRTQYDRELSRRRGYPHPHAHSAANPVGGRPASGLSRRRTQFHGPPPSFYRNGMWGKTGRGPSGTEASGSATRPPRDAAEAAAAGMGGFGYGAPQSGRRDDVPHFDFERHRMQQERRRRRPTGPQGPKFFVPGGVLLPAVGVVILLFTAVGLSSRTIEPVRVGAAGTSSGKTKPQSS